MSEQLLAQAPGYSVIGAIKKAEKHNNQSERYVIGYVYLLEVESPNKYYTDEITSHSHDSLQSIRYIGLNRPIRSFVST